MQLLNQQIRNDQTLFEAEMGIKELEKQKLQLEIKKLSREVGDEID